MTRTTIAVLFIVSTVAFVVGATMGIVTTVSAVANGAIEIGGSQLVTLHPGQIGAAIAAYAVASAIAVAGSIALYVSWAGALLNTWRLDDRSWFAGILGAGVVGLAWVATAVYLVAGPDRRAAPTTNGTAAISA